MTEVQPKFTKMLSVTLATLAKCCDTIFTFFVLMLCLRYLQNESEMCSLILVSIIISTVALVYRVVSATEVRTYFLCRIKSVVITRQVSMTNTTSKIKVPGDYFNREPPIIVYVPDSIVNRFKSVLPGWDIQYLCLKLGDVVELPDSKFTNDSSGDFSI